ncbi:MAG: ATP-binding cassette domain-containing protein [Pyrinomonadaceae bacterium]
MTQPGVVKDISFSLFRGEILGISGLMGAGRTELARILFGLDPYQSGQILVDGIPHKKAQPRSSIKQGMAFLTENRREEGLLMSSSLSENMALPTLPRFASEWLKLIDVKRVRSVRRRNRSGGALKRHRAKSRRSCD